MSNEFRLQRRKSRNNDKSQLIRSNSVEARIETNPRVATNDYPVAKIRHKNFDEPIANDWFNTLRSDLHENPNEFVVEKNKETPKIRNKPARFSKSLETEETKSQWNNSLRSDLHSDNKCDFDFTYDRKLSKSLSNVSSVKEMIKVKEDRRKRQKEISCEWFNSLRSDVHENPRPWVALPYINESK